MPHLKKWTSCLWNYTGDFLERDDIMAYYPKLRRENKSMVSRFATAVSTKVCLVQKKSATHLNDRMERYNWVFMILVTRRRVSQDLCSHSISGGPNSPTGR